MSAQTYRIERATRASRIGAVVALAFTAGVLSLPWWGDRADIRLFTEILYTLALAQSWNLLAGYGGLISVGQQGFVGLGAYWLVVFGLKWGVSAFVAVPLAGLATAVLAIPVAAIAFRLRGAYFAVGTWVISEVFRLLVTNSDYLAGGQGTSVGPILRNIPIWWRDGLTLWFATALGIGTTAGMYLLLRSRLGLSLKAIRDSEPAAESAGVSVTGIKWGVFIAASFTCGAAGALAFITKLRVAPEAAFSLDWTTTMIFLVVIGGIGTIEGPIVGAVVFFILRSLLADYGTIYLIVLGTIAVVVMLKIPEGVYGYFARRTGVDFFPVQRRLVMANEEKKA